MVDRESSVDVGGLVSRRICEILGARGRGVDRLIGDERLGELGLTSLELAGLVTELNVRFAVNPFARTAAFTELRTVADVCRAYSRAASAPDLRSPGSAELDESQRRALARRGAWRR